MWGETLHDMVAPIAIYKFTPQEFDNESFSLRFSLKTLTDRRQLLVNPLKFLMLLPIFTNFPSQVPLLQLLEEEQLTWSAAEAFSGCIALGW